MDIQKPETDIQKQKTDIQSGCRTVFWITVVIGGSAHSPGLADLDVPVGGRRSVHDLKVAGASRGAAGDDPGSTAPRWQLSPPS